MKIKSSNFWLGVSWLLMFVVDLVSNLASHHYPWWKVFGTVLELGIGVLFLLASVEDKKKLVK